MAEINLTLDPAGAQAAKTALQEIAPVVEQTASAAEQYKQKFTEEEQQIIDAFAQKIDITNTDQVFSYGSAAQQKIAGFSDAALRNVQTKDLGPIGDMIGTLIAELKGFSAAEEEKSGIFGFFKKNVNRLAKLQAQYTDAETNVNKIVAGLEQHQIQLLKDIATLDQLYEENLTYFKELSMYIEAGKLCVKSVRENELVAAQEKARKSNLPEDAQAVNDLAAKIDRFEKKIYDLELTRNVSLQMAPQIRLLQNSNQTMAEKIQSSLVNTIPLWKSQMVLALGLHHSQEALEAQRAVTDLTNSLLKSNAEALHTATVETAKEAERGIVDIETLTHTNELLISTMDEVLAIQRDGRAKREAAEKELAAIEKRLREKLMEIN
ncbi:MAG: toxic anion resistance protein [Christensenellales bacterium]|jgi:uncharacterized protein YaaN involved in tellurite resistance